VNFFLPLFQIEASYFIENGELEEVEPLARAVYNITDPDLYDKLVKSLSYNMVDDLLNLVFWGLTKGNFTHVDLFTEKLIRFATLIMDEKQLIPIDPMNFPERNMLDKLLGIYERDLEFLRMNITNMENSYQAEVELAHRLNLPTAKDDHRTRKPSETTTPLTGNQFYRNQQEKAKEAELSSSQSLQQITETYQKEKEAHLKRFYVTKAIYDFFLKLKPRIIPDDNYPKKDMNMLLRNYGIIIEQKELKIR
jgi:hypothetical protein